MRDNNDIKSISEAYVSMLTEAKVKTLEDAAKKLEKVGKDFGGTDKTALKKYADMLRKDGYNAIPSIEKDKRRKDTIVRDAVDAVLDDLQDSLRT